MSDVIIEQFIDKLTSFYGRAFTIVTGQDSYTFGKETHANMLDHEGVYLLLENLPFTDTRRKYDKATLITADSVNRMVPTNDPSLVKKGFSLSGAKLRIVMYKQCVKLFQATPILIREVVFAKPRKVFRLDRNDWYWLTKNNGELIFICTIRYGATKRLVDVIRIAANNIAFENGQNSKAIPLDLDGIVLKRINDMGFTVSSQYGVLTNEQYADRINGIPFIAQTGYEIETHGADRAGSLDKLIQELSVGKSPETSPEPSELETQLRLPEKPVLEQEVKEFLHEIAKTRALGSNKLENDIPQMLITEGQPIRIILPSNGYEFEIQGTITSVKRKPTWKPT